MALVLGRVSEAQSLHRENFQVIGEAAKGRGGDQARMWSPGKSTPVPLHAWLRSTHCAVEFLC